MTGVVFRACGSNILYAFTVAKLLECAQSSAAFEGVSTTRAPRCNTAAVSKAQLKRSPVALAPGMNDLKRSFHFAASATEELSVFVRLFVHFD
jgi:hypothetical protein